MKKLFILPMLIFALAAIVLVMTSDVFAMSSADADGCLSDTYNTSLQETYEEFDETYIRLAQFVPPFNLQVYMVEFIRERTESSSVRTCSDLENVYKAGTAEMNKILHTVEE